MKSKNVVLVFLGILFSFAQYSYSQQRQVYTENFDESTVSFSSSPSNSWVRNNVYSTSYPNSYRGYVPNSPGDSSVLVTPPYDLSNYLNSHIQLRFNHICKVSPSDITRIEYRYDEIGPMGQWTEIPFSDYQGSASNYGSSGFNAASYSQWAANDSLKKPEASWWKQEVFDLTGYGYPASIQFRFVLKHGDSLGTQISYGWLIDDFQLIADNQDIFLPTIEFVSPLVQDTVYSTGPFTVTARIQSTSSMALKTPIYLKYRSFFQGNTFDLDSVEMTNVRSDIWTGVIPKMFLHASVDYSVTASDIIGNTTTVTSGYYIGQDKPYGDNSAAIKSIDAPEQNSLLINEYNKIKVTIHNKGNLDLDSVYIHWSVNGVEGNFYKWTGNLPWDYTAQVEIDSFIVLPNVFSTLQVWLALPNGVIDPITDDDTLTQEYYGCEDGLAGDYTIERNTGFFHTIKDAIHVLSLCDMSSNVTFKLADDTYLEPIDLTLLEGNVHANYTLTIKSGSGNRDNVIVKPASGSGVIIGQMNNLVIEAITIDVNNSAGEHAIQFLSPCSNIVVQNCNLWADTAVIATGKNVINRPISSGYTENIYILNNHIKGGYYGVYFYGAALATDKYGSNIFVNDNLIEKQSSFGIHLQYIDGLSVLHNTILSRDLSDGNLLDEWRGMTLNYISGKIDGNRIKQKTQAITKTSGIHLTNISNAYNSNTRSTIANNEITLYSVGDYFGISVTTGIKANIVNNSIFMGGTGANKALRINNDAANVLVVKNNNLVSKDNDSYPIYLAGITYVKQWDIDYNNYFAPKYIGYAVNGKTKFSNWSDTVTSDIHSVRIQPDFIDSTISLELADYVGLECPTSSSVDMDINKVPRVGLTTMGSYEGVLLGIDAAVTGIVYNPNITLLNQNDTVRVILTNGGTTPLISATINWKLNDVGQQQESWTGYLQRGESDTIALKPFPIIYQTGQNLVKAWVTMTGDEYIGDDTISYEHFICDSMLNGTYIVGQNGVFSNVSEAIDRMMTCGINGPVTLALQNGEYQDSIIFSQVPGSSPVNTITLTSESGNKDQVIIRPVSGVGIELGNMNNLVIRDITIDVITGTYAIQFMSACTNIVIDNCILLANSETTNSGYGCIYKNNGTGTLNNIRITNNIMDGGNRSIYIYGGTTLERGTDIVIDSNEMRNFYAYGISAVTIDFNSLSYNTILSKITSQTNAWYGMELLTCKGLINGNRIIQRSDDLSSSSASGIRLYYNSSNNDITKKYLVTNNEIMLSSSSTATGIEVAGENKMLYASILNNSVYMKGTGATRGIRVQNYDNVLTIKNNNLVIESASGYPIYLTGIAYVNQWDIDYNNYYAPTNIGYAGSSHISFLTWRNIVKTDVNSVKTLPSFIDTRVSLAIANNVGLRCPMLPEVTEDINEIQRTSVTTMGAYTLEQYSLDVAPYAFINIPEMDILGKSIPVSVTIENQGADIITDVIINWSVNGVVNATPINWTGSLLPTGITTPIFLGNYNLVAGENKFLVWTSRPNNLTDENPTNDTLLASTLVCDGPLEAGTYTVEKFHGDFTELSKVMKILETCGVNGPVVFSIYPGKYAPLSFRNIQGSSSTNNLKFVSHTGIAEDVVINSIIFDTTHDITIEKIFIDPTTTLAAIEFKAPVRNINIIGCKIMANPLAVTDKNSTRIYGIYKPQNTGRADNIRIVGNDINGGYAGIHFYGGIASDYGTNVIIDSNNINNAYYFGVNLYYANFPSISHNTVLGRTTPSGSYYYGLYVSQSNVGKINGNKLTQRAEHNAPFGMMIDNMNKLPASPGLITNNDIIMYRTGRFNANNSAFNGITIRTSSNVECYFNSIFAGGGSGVSAFNLATNSYGAVIKYNNLMAADSCFPICIQGGIYELNSNNYYSKPYIAYDGTTRFTSIGAWDTAKHDNSVSVQPHFIDSTTSLELSDYTGLGCDALPYITADIKGNVRAGKTVMGAYASTPLNVEAVLSEVVDWKAYPVPGSKDTIKVVLKNGGVTTLTEATIGWSFNNDGPKTSVTWTGNLQTGESVIISLDEVEYALENNNLSVWINEIKNSGTVLADDFPADDTISVSGYGCMTMRGVYTVGPNGYFNEIADAVKVLYTCGIDSTVIFELEPNHTFVETVTLQGKIAGSNDTNMVIFMPASGGDTTNTKVQRAGATNAEEAPFILDGVSNVKISNLALIGTTTSGTPAYGRALILKNGCNNIEISGCKLSSYVIATATTSANYSVVYRPSGTSVNTNIRILDNIIEGGAYGIYFNVSSTVRDKNIVIRNNIIRNVDTYGMRLNYCDSTEITNNTIEQRNLATPGELYGIYLNTGSANIIKNKIHAYKMYHGIYTESINTSTQDSALIINNEIRGDNVTTNGRSGIYIAANTHAKILHNSVYVKGTSTGYGLAVANSAATFLEIKNNNLVTNTSSTAVTNYPIYIADAANIPLSNINYNNYYNQTGGNIGFAGVATPTLSDWKAEVLTDQGSMNSNPNFVNSSIDLSLSTTDGLQVSRLPNVLTDIRDTVRKTTTTVGAYHKDPVALDIYPAEIVSPSGLEMVNGSYPLEVTIRNAGASTITSADIYWKLNGGATSVAFNWTGNLNQEEVSAPIKLVDISNLIAGNNELIVWTSNPNNSNDMRPINDTLKMTVFGCDSALHGTYTVGPTSKYKTLPEAISALYYCGVQGPVTMALEDGDYDAVEITGLIPGANATNTVTFTSLSQDSNKVKIRRIGNPKEDNAAFTLNNVSYIRLSHLHFDATINGALVLNYAYARAIRFKGECRDIEITNCQLTLPSDPDTVRTATTSSSDYVAMYFKSTNQQNIHNVNILNNRFDGGACGIYIYSDGSTAYCTHVLIQNNTFENIDKYGIFTYYADSSYILNNVIAQRKKEDVTGKLTSFYGIYYRYTKRGGRVENNRITGDSLYHGIILDNDGALCANNEIRGNMEGGSNRAAIYSSSSTVDIFHNSILITSGGAGARGIQFTPSASSVVNAKNNIIVMLDSTHYPMYLGSGVPATIAYSDIDYNNYYAPLYIGYAGNAKRTMSSWTDTVKSDLHSVKIYPVYMDSAINLQIINYTDYKCPSVPQVHYDILGNIRSGKTTMGAYNYETPISMDVSLQQIIDIPDYIGTTDFASSRIVFKNEGTTPITSLEVSWTLNGNSKPSFSWPTTGSKSVTIFEVDTVDIPLFHPDLGTNNIKAWISSVNNSGLDENQANDTVNASFSACDSLFKGEYIIGKLSGADFSSVAAAISQMEICGVGGDVYFKLQDDTYPENWDFTSFGDIMGNYILTITSLSGDKENVIIRPSSGVVATLGNTKNLILDGITLDGTVPITGTYVIQFTTACTNIVIINCDIKANATAASPAAGVVAIYKASSTAVENIRITNNNINGGHTAISFYGGSGTSSAAQMGKYVIIENNNITNVFNTGIYLYNTYGMSVSYNSIQSRATSSTWYGIRISSSSGSLYANKIHHIGTASSIRGIDLSAHNRYIIQDGKVVVNDGSENGLIANNEIMINTTGTQAGIYSAILSNSNIFNNSIYVKGTGASRGIEFSGTATAQAIKNNNIVMESSNAYPVYFSSYSSLWDIDYNNYSAPQYIGYVGGAQTSLPVFQGLVMSDSNSVSIRPNFVDPSKSLELSDYTGLGCPRLPEVLDNIDGIARTRYTTMGAYSLATPEKYDLALSNIVEPANSNTLCSPDFVPVKLEVTNVGTVDHDFSIDRIELYFSMTNLMGLPPFDTIVTVESGILESFQSMVFDLKDFVNVSYAGDYNMTAWISNSKDTIHSNDTILNQLYRNTKIALPFDDDFSTPDLAHLTVQKIRGDSVWKVEQGMDPDSIIAPYYGTGKLVFNGTPGAMSMVSTGQLELNRTQEPVLEFWYEHDNNDLNDADRDYMDVLLTYDGGKTSTLLMRLYRYGAQYTTPTWEYYKIDLSQYQDSSCVVVSFLAFTTGGIHQIDRIAISSNQDLAVSKTLISSYSVCELKAKELKIVVTNETNQNIDFSKAENNTALTIEVTHNGNLISENTYPLTGLLEGLKSDTITDTQLLDLAKGTYIVTSYLTKSIDNNPKNDIRKDTIVINPALSVHVDQMSGGTTNCLMGGSLMPQTISIANTGNMDLSNIGLILQIDTGETGDPLYLYLKETYTGTIAVGNTVPYEFKTSYTVPWNPEYQVTVFAYLVCDSSLANTASDAQECTDMKDVYLVSIDNPFPSVVDRAGEAINVGVTLRNRSDVYDFSNVRISVLIEDSKGNKRANFTETGPTVRILSTENYTFKNSYTVPNDTVYYLTVYLDTYDAYTNDDTIRIRRVTDYIDDIGSIERKVSISMDQNFPNPANDNTIVRYSVPESGEVIFRIHSVNGQLLYDKTVQSEGGTNNIEISTSGLSAGIYVYSMEYKGQRIVKRMSIKR